MIPIYSVVFLFEDQKHIELLANFLSTDCSLRQNYFKFSDNCSTNRPRLFNISNKKYEDDLLLAHTYIITKIDFEKKIYIIL